MTAVLLPNGKQQYFTTAGLPAVGYKIATFDAGTSNPRVTWQDALKVAQNANPVILDGRGEASIFWEGAYKVQLQDSTGAVIWTQDNLQSQPNGFAATVVPSVTNTFDLGSVSLTWRNAYFGANGLALIDSGGNAGFYARTAAEIAAAVTPTDYFYLEGDLRRYGGDSTGAADASTAWQAAINVGIARLAKSCSYKIITPATKTGQVTILGEGPTSKLLSDATVLTVTSGNGSFVDNFWMENLTAPYIITRNPSNWAAVLTPAQSNGLGYQPTVNDPEYATWVAGQPLVGSQNIGPTISFTGAASDITVSRIYGRFVRINILDALNSIVRDCDFQGGKGVRSAILFDNCSNNIQQGQNNQAINNRVGYASQCGITFFSNVDFTMRGNTCYNCGQSGTQTAQSGGVAFTASVGGATSGTLTAGWTSPIGTWTFGFPDGETRSVVITAPGQTAVTWSGALSAGTLLNAAFWGIAGSPSSLMDPRCGRGQIIDNRTYNNYYDGLDCMSTFGISNDATQSHHQIHNNYSFRNRGDGINTDGQFNSVVGNHLFFNGVYGIWGICSLSEIVGNILADNNQSRSVGNAEILAVGALASNKIADNYIWGGPTQNCPAISVTQTAINYVSDNIGTGVSNNNLGNIGSVASVADGNVDNITGAFTPQSFCFELTNNAGVMQHIFYSDSSNQSAGLYSRIANATSGAPTNTPTGADGATAMAGGAKIGSALTNAVWFDTAVQNPTGILMNAVIVFNNSGTALNVQPMFQSININGVTRQRLTFQFTNQTTGAAFALTPANIAAGKGIYVQFNGKLS